MKHLNLILATLSAIFALVLVNIHVEGLSLVLLFSAILFVLREKRGS